MLLERNLQIEKEANANGLRTLTAETNAFIVESETEKTDLLFENLKAFQHLLLYEKGIFAHLSLSIFEWCEKETDTESQKNVTSTIGGKFGD